MEYRNLGRSGLRVSAVGLGGNNFGRQVDEAGTAAIVNKALDMGVTFFETADVYGDRGRSEEFLGRALKPHRRNVVIASKAGGRMGEGPYWSGASRRYLTDAVDACLRRLDTDYIDLFQLHFPDPGTPIEETLRALDDIVRSGKVRYIGCCNFAGWQVVEAALVAKQKHLTPIISAQNRYNILERDLEKDLLPGASKYGVGLLPYYPLAAGLLTGKYRRGEPAPEGTRLASGIGFYAGILSDHNLELVERLTAFAEARGHSILELAIGWLLTNPAVGCVMAGVTRLEQVESNCASSGWRLTAEEMQEVEAILTTPPASG